MWYAMRCTAAKVHPGLQVEHPVTEWISNVNIPACQLLIGMGIPLSQIPDIRRLYGKDLADTTSPIDFELDRQIAPSGEQSIEKGAGKQQAGAPYL